MTKPESILIVDDDDAFRRRLAKALAHRGFEVVDAPDVTTALERTETAVPDYAVIDLRMPGSSGLQLLDQLRKRRSDICMVVLTGYGSITTAKEALRRGAVDYLTKPADADQILAVLMGTADDIDDDGAVPTLGRVEWEHIQRVLSECGGNVSKAARVLGIHRRSLQRKLKKFPPQD